MMRTSIGATLLLCLVCKVAEAQSRPRMFAGVAAGIATLAADARSEITSSGADVSLYKPENGPALNIFVGSHVHEYLTVQGNYVWNRNDVTLTSVRCRRAWASFDSRRRLVEATVSETRHCRRRLLSPLTRSCEWPSASTCRWAATGARGTASVKA